MESGGVQEERRRAGAGAAGNDGAAGWWTGRSHVRGDRSGVGVGGWRSSI